MKYDQDLEWIVGVVLDFVCVYICISAVLNL